MSLSSYHIGLVEELSSWLYEPLVSLNYKKNHLHKLKHDRRVIGMWREIRDVLIQQNIPISNSLIIMPSKENKAFFFWEPDRNPVIYLPTKTSCLSKIRGLNLTEISAKWGELLVFLHELGHAYINPPMDYSWRYKLDKDILYYVDPAWIEVDDYIGWRVFNEIFADVWSSAWLLRLSGHDRGAVELIASMREYRDYYERHFNQINYPCLHPTQLALSSCIKINWDISFDDMIDKIFAISQESFRSWLYKDDFGKMACKISMDKLLDRERKLPFTSSFLSISGNDWRKPGREENIESKKRLVSLYEYISDHPIFEFESARKYLA